MSLNIALLAVPRASDERYSAVVEELHAARVEWMKSPTDLNRAIYDKANEAFVKADLAYKVTRQNEANARRKDREKGRA